MSIKLHITILIVSSSVYARTDRQTDTHNRHGHTYGQTPLKQYLLCQQHSSRAHDYIWCALRYTKCNICQSYLLFLLQYYKAI